MSHDSTAVRISLYFGLIWLAGGFLSTLHHFHSLTPLHIGLAVFLSVLTVMGFFTVTYTNKIVLKLVAEPLTAAGVLGSGVGYLLYLWYPVVTLIAGAVVLGIFGAALYEEKESRARAARNKADLSK